MRADIWLGVVTVFMAVLGGIVSAHAPTKLWHKIAYISSFVIAGAASIWLVIRISNENAQATRDLSNALIQLKQSTNSIAQMAVLNTQLQERLLKQSDAITKISQQNLDEITGKKGYCYLIATINPTDRDISRLPLVLFNPTKYPVIGAIADVMEAIKSGDGQDEIMRKLNSKVSLELGDVWNTYARQLNYRIPVRKDIDNEFQITIFSRGKGVTERLVISWDKDHWAEDYELPNTHKKIRPDFPCVTKNN